MSNLSRIELRARYNLFKQFAYDDQRQFYESAITHARTAGAQVNRLRALFALTTGFASALAGLIVQVSLGRDMNCALGKPMESVAALPASNCGTIQIVANILLALAVIAPAFAGALNILSDLFQWDRLTSIYSAAFENMEVAYAYTPEDDMPDDEFRFSVETFGKDTLAVMSEETAQWGQSVRTPPTLEMFLRQEADKAARAGTDLLHAADKLQTAADAAEAGATTRPDDKSSAPPAFREPSVG